jgi:hypothetical protein
MCNKKQKEVVISALLVYSGHQGMMRKYSMGKHMAGPSTGPRVSGRRLELTAKVSSSLAKPHQNRLDMYKVFTK